MFFSYTLDQNDTHCSFELSSLTNIKKLFYIINYSLWSIFRYFDCYSPNTTQLPIYRNKSIILVHFLIMIKNECTPIKDRSILKLYEHDSGIRKHIHVEIETVPVHINPIKNIKRVSRPDRYTTIKIYEYR